MIFVSCLSSAPPMTKRVPAGARGALLPLAFLPFPRPFFFAAFCSGFCAWLRWPFFPAAAFRSPVLFPAIKRNSPRAALQKSFGHGKLSVANQLSPHGEDVLYLESLAAHNQRVGVAAPFQPSLSIELQNARGVGGYQWHDKFERESALGHAGANLVVEVARTRDRGVG